MKPQQCRDKFLSFFPNGFYDEKYLDWERDYKWKAHERWSEVLHRSEFERLLREENFEEIVSRASRVEGRTSLLFSFEKMALRDGVREKIGAESFASGLFDWLYGAGEMQEKFERWIEIIDALPRKQTRVLTHPIVTVWGFLAQPETHIYLKPNTMRRAALEYGFDFHYHSRPSWAVYSSLLEFAEVVKYDLADLKPRDMIDIQSFLWVQGSHEYS